MAPSPTPSAPRSPGAVSQSHRVLGHGLVRMTGRDPHEPHRAATPLELLFDLTLVVAFAQAGEQFSHLIAEGHFGAAIGGFAFAMFATCWAWINFTWFASAFDTNDWFYRLMTMVQMLGIVVLALGLPAMFHSLDEGGHIDNRIMVAGYVVMRVALVAQWLRAAQQDPGHRTAALTYVKFIAVAQVGWVAIAVADTSIAVAAGVGLVLFLIELGGPYVAERYKGGTPWHAHHVAERYGLLVIIALGEIVLGTIISVAALVELQGWSKEAVFVVVAGIGLTFGLWWTYFVLPSAEVLHRHRDRSFGWGYGHMLIFAAIAATGAGLHTAAYVVEDHAEIGTFGAVVSMAVPVLLFSVVLIAMYTYLVREKDTFHLLLLAGTVLVLGLAMGLAALGASLGVCLILVTLAPVVFVVGFEAIGHQHAAEALERALR